MPKVTRGGQVGLSVQDAALLADFDAGCRGLTITDRTTIGPSS